MFSACPKCGRQARDGYCSYCSVHFSTSIKPKESEKDEPSVASVTELVKKLAAVITFPVWMPFFFFALAFGSMWSVTSSFVKGEKPAYWTQTCYMPPTNRSYRSAKS